MIEFTLNANQSITKRLSGQLQISIGNGGSDNFDGESISGVLGNTTLTEVDAVTAAKVVRGHFSAKGDDVTFSTTNGGGSPIITVQIKP